MVPLLKKDIQFVPREEEGLVVLCRELPNGSKAEIRIHPIQAFIMVLFDGQNDKSKVAQVIAEVMSIEPQAAVDIVETLLNRFSLFFYRHAFIRHFITFS